ncbi:MAG: phosphotransacetylase [Candidatus Omnitrophica bacterium]|nr:phosphotransacetylase [Candidatus Omnitrophota bacterium]
MEPISFLRNKAKAQLRKIILPETEDVRVVEAGYRAAEAGIARVFFLGEPDEVRKKLKVFGKYSEETIEIIDPNRSKIFDSLADRFYEKRKHKNSNKNVYKKLISEDSVYFAALMLDAGLADGFVAGAHHTTGDVAKAAIYCLGVDQVIGVASGSFIMYVEASAYGDKGLFIFADCGLVPDPNPRQLGGIAVSTAELYSKLFDRTSYVAMLSYSTKSSASGPLIQKVRDGLMEAKKLKPDIIIDGELQIDSALDIEVAKKKTSVKGSPVAGKANVLIFPNLDSGNIGYKLVQRLAGARAVGPILQGLNKPCSDLSRGCSVDDIVDAIAVTVVRAQE